MEKSDKKLGPTLITMFTCQGCTNLNGAGFHYRCVITENDEWQQYQLNQLLETPKDWCPFINKEMRKLKLDKIKKS